MILCMGRIHRRIISNPTLPNQSYDYSRFDAIDGSHSLQKSVPETCVMYPVRKVSNGKIAYFNFALAKEMGLLPKQHAETLNKTLEKKLLDTFSLRIINEYDQSQNVKFHPSVLKKNMYMATRYLQLQHKDKTGRTSGDGRSVWNGELIHHGVTWDISSRGTGVTKLAPGSVQASQPLRTGDSTHGYGCGTADIDELISSAIQAEIFYNNGVNTERVLCVIDYGDGNGVGVRAGKNLFRPAHLFMYLKQRRLDELKRATDYLIDRQYNNKEWPFHSQSKNKYDLMLNELTSGFAKFAAQLDRDYIFAWLDWDGDNVLFNAGIIDYGSIRQFGLRHDQYRYDDLDRFSTNLNEQKHKAKELVQAFAQMVDYIKTGTHKSFKDFSNHSAVKDFDYLFELHLLDQFLTQVGITTDKRTWLLQKRKKIVQKLYESFFALERIKTKKKTKKVSDGINRPAILNMRILLYELPSYLIRNQTKNLMLPSVQELFKMALAKSAKGIDRKLTSRVRHLFAKFTKNYTAIIKEILPERTRQVSLQQIYDQAFHANRPDRLTGDGLLYVVDELIDFKKENGRRKTLQETIDRLILEQSPPHLSKKLQSTVIPISSSVRPLFNTILSLVDGNKESI